MSSNKRDWRAWLPSETVPRALLAAFVLALVTAMFFLWSAHRRKAAPFEVAPAPAGLTP